MKILFADLFPDNHLAHVSAMGHECVYEPGLGTEELVTGIVGFDAVVVRSTKITAEVISAAPGLRLIVRAGAGTNTIDVSAATERGIYVCNVPGMNSIAVAELAFALIASIYRNIPDTVADFRAGRWRKSHYSKTTGIYGQALGIVGVGDVGLALAERARAFGMDIYVVDKPERNQNAADRLAALHVRAVESLHALASTVDVLSVHVPLTEGTTSMIGEDVFAAMRPGSVLINTSRGEVVDEPALLEAMDTKGIRAGLDVFWDEPDVGEAEWSSAVAQHPNVYGTPHIGASTAQAQDAVAAGAAHVISLFDEGTVINCVNVDQLGDSPTQERSPA